MGFRSTCTWWNRYLDTWVALNRTAIECLISSIKYSWELYAKEPERMVHSNQGWVIFSFHKFMAQVDLNLVNPEIQTSGSCIYS